MCSWGLEAWFQGWVENPWLIVGDVRMSKGKDPFEELRGPMTRARARKAKEALQQILFILF